MREVQSVPGNAPGSWACRVRFFFRRTCACCEKHGAFIPLVMSWAVEVAASPVGSREIEIHIPNRTTRSYPIAGCV